MAMLFDPGLFSIEGLAGEILPGTTLGWFVSGTSTPLATYQDDQLTVPNQNPLTVGSDGRLPPIWLQEQSYKMVMTLPDGTVITRDPVRNPTISALTDMFLVSGLPFDLPDEANGDPVPAPGSRLPYLSAGVMKIA